MIKANSLLYAIYVCLIVSLLCGALLYMANLYNQLNAHYSSHEALYIHNQSLVNFAMGNVASPTALPDEDETTGIESIYEIKQYGLLPLVKVSSVFKNDTVTSVHFAALTTTSKTCVYVPNFGLMLNYSGTVKLIGTVNLPSTYIKGIYIDNQLNKLDVPQINVSAPTLPDLSKAIKKAFTFIPSEKVQLKNVLKKDSLYYNSFLNPTQQIDFTGSDLANITIKGNIIISSNDSIKISKTAHLDDVIIMAQKIYFEDGFKGSIQAFATEKINLGSNVKLSYPSILCLNNTSAQKGSLSIKNNSSIYGAIIMYGNEKIDIKNNSISIDKNCIIVGDVYCTGSLSLQSNIYGSVYTNKFLYNTPTSVYDNCIANIEINALKRPANFMSIPLFDNNLKYGALKKLM